MNSGPFTSLEAMAAARDRGWQSVPLRRVARLKYGESLLDIRDDEHGQVPIYGSNGLIGYGIESNASGPCLIIGRKGSAGRLNYVTADCYAGDTTFFIDSSSTKADTRWLYYALQSIRLEQQSGDSAVPGLSREFAENQLLSVPPGEEQRAIAQFLDEETGKIDTLIDKKSRLIERLQEERTSRVDEAVSSYGNLDSLPTGWALRRNKTLFREVNEKPDRDMELLTVSHLTGVTSRAEKQVYMFMAESFDDYKVCQDGDLIINTMWAWMGAAGVAPQEGIVSPSYGVYRLLPNAPLLPEFLGCRRRVKTEHFWPVEN